MILRFRDGFGTLLSAYLVSWVVNACQAAQEKTVPSTQNLWTSMESWAGRALTLWGYVDSFAQEECPNLFRCPNDLLPKANPLHSPLPNGCGSFGYNVDIFVADGMSKCCNNHDICFATCGSRKGDCDVIFKKCLYDVCRKEADNDSDTRSGKVCQISAKLLYGATSLAGCSSFQLAQSTACVCDFKSDKRSRTTARPDL